MNLVPERSGLVKFKAVVVLLFLIVSPLNASLLSMGHQADPTTPIQHIIVLMQENHSFDNYFGTYPTANGTLTNSITSQLETVNGIPNGVCLPYNGDCISPMAASSSINPDPVEGQLTYEADIDNGSMTGFPVNSGPQSMIYFDYRQIPAYWDYAEEYGLADDYFASALSTTLPNRLMLLEGTSQFSSTDESSPDFSSDLYNTLSGAITGTILYQLAENGISWGYFDFFSSLPFESNAPFGLGTSVQNVSSLYNDLATGSNLPQVSFVSSLGANGLDELSPDNVTIGEQWTVSVVNALEKSSYWDSSAIFITWDEGGGYYDGVAPPQILRIDDNSTDPLLGYGQRVPLIVISPYAKENYVSQTLLNHMSLTKFIDYDFDLPALNQNVANSNNLLDFFDFGQTPRAPIVLGSSGNFSYGTYPLPLQQPLSSLSYVRTGSYTGSESTQQPTSAGSVLGQIKGVFTGSEQLIDNLVSNRTSSITISQVYSVVYLIAMVVLLIIILRVAVGLTRRRRARPEEGGASKP